MDIAVASTSSASANDSTSVTVTAPSSIATDDLLVIVASCGGNITHTSTGFTEAFRYYYNSGGAGQNGTITVLYKVAVLADESATDYTVTGSESNRMGAVAMFRLAGTATSGTQIFDYSTGNGFVFDGENLTFSVSDSITRPVQGAHFIVGACFDNDSFTGEVDFNTYQITSSDSNPTWTEIAVDDNYQTGDSLNYYGAMSMAYATSTDTSAITSWGFDLDTTSLDETALVTGVYFSVLAPTNASGSNNLLTTDGTIFTQSGTSDASASNTLLTTTTTVNSQTGVGEEQIWTTTSKPSTTWTTTNK